MSNRKLQAKYKSLQKSVYEIKEYCLTHKSGCKKCVFYESNQGCIFSQSTPNIWEIKGLEKRTD